jgi:hypothetical protein
MTRLISLAAIAGLAGLAACAEDEPDPRTRITSARVLAITTEPSTLQLDGEISLVVLTVDADGPRTGVVATAAGERPVDAMRVRACAPWILLADPARECVGENALPLDVDGDGRVVTSAAQLAAAFPAPPGTSAPADAWRASLAAGVELRVPFVVEVDVDGGTVVARRDVSVVDTSESHLNPRLAELRFDGVATRALRSGQPYRLTAAIDRASLDARPDAAPGEIENVTVHYYSSAGELAEPDVALDDPAALAPETADNTYTAGPPGTTWMYAVATDETGGMSATAVEIVVE